MAPNASAETIPWSVFHQTETNFNKPKASQLITPTFFLLPNNLRPHWQTPVAILRAAPWQGLIGTQHDIPKKRSWPPTGATSATKHERPVGDRERPTDSRMPLRPQKFCIYPNESIWRTRIPTPCRRVSWDGGRFSFNDCKPKA